RAPRVRPITTADYPTPARRPAYSHLDTARLRTDFGIDPPHWRAGLQQVVARLAAAAPRPSEWPGIASPGAARRAWVRRVGGRWPATPLRTGLAGAGAIAWPLLSWRWIHMVHRS